MVGWAKRSVPNVVGSLLGTSLALLCPTLRWPFPRMERRLAIGRLGKAQRAQRGAGCWAGRWRSFAQPTMAFPTHGAPVGW